MTVPLLLTLPWLAFVLFVALRVRLPPELPDAGTAAGEDGVSPTPSAAADGSEEPGGLPVVSVIVPARDEAHNIERVVSSLARSRYPRFEILVVDDRSEDGTAEIARSVAPGNADRLEVIEGAPLPEGWLGKPWACWQGAERARGGLLLFTDADTEHGPELLGRAVRALLDEDGDAVTVAGRQRMESFWERVVQPHVFLSMILRYYDLSEPVPRERWRSAIANGQYILFDAASYRELGGHRAVRDAVVEDLRLAQRLVREGWSLLIRRAEDDLATRMYRSLGEIVRGWSKNIVLGGLQTLPPAIRRLAPVPMVLSGIALWVLPPVALILAATGALGGGWLAWSAPVVALSILFWIGVSRRFGVPGVYGLLYPLGAAVGVGIFLRSWLGMRRVRWKGREYRAELPAE